MKLSEPRPSMDGRLGVGAGLSRRSSVANTRELLAVPGATGGGPNLSRRSSIANVKDTLNGSITIGTSPTSILHRIPELKVQTMKIEEEYDIEKTIAEGCFAKIYLTNHRPTNSTIVLKAIHAELMTFKEFLKEYHYTYQLSHHPNILKCYQVAFQTDDYYIFAMEHAPFGDLSAHCGSGGIPELFCKSIAEQISAALGFMHFKSLVHRDVKLENVLVFAPEFSRVKLCDFGATTREGTLVNKSRHTWTAFLAPEVLEVVKNERFICKTSSDSWQFGVLLFHCLTGSAPWQAADWGKDPNYSAFVKYQKKKTTTIPENFRKFTTRLVRAFRKILDPDPDNRAKVTEIMKYMKNKWLNTKTGTAKSFNNVAFDEADQDSICIYINQREPRVSVDVDNPRTRTKRLMSVVATNDTHTNDQDKRILEWVLKSGPTQDSDVEKF